MSVRAEFKFSSSSVRNSISQARREKEGQPVRVQFEFTFRQVHFFFEAGVFEFSSSSRSHRK